MKKLLGCLISIIGFAVIGLEVRAETKVELVNQCTQAVQIGGQATAANLASKVALLVGITDGKLQNEGLHKKSLFSSMKIVYCQYSSF